MMNNKVNEQLKKYYENLEKYDNTAQQVGWKNEQAQHIRFQQLAKIIDTKSDFEINDLGCGLAHFVDFLTKNNFTLFKYYGYDIYEKMITIAIKNNTNNFCFFKTTNNSNNINLADYTIASGIFNLCYENTEAQWISYILNELEIMNKKSKKGFAFNMLTKYSDFKFMKEGLYYADPCFIFDFCKNNFSKNVALLHDYDEYDFTILVRK